MQEEKRRIINAASLANIPLTEFTTQMEELYRGGVRFFHVDLMDGHYVPNLCFPIRVISDLKKAYPDCVVDLHMMVDNPADYIETVSREGADYISFHVDSTSFPRRLLGEIRKRGKKAGLVLNPSQRVEILEPLLPYLDYVVFMAVEPGFAGQEFLEGSMERIMALSELRKKSGNNFMLMVDGGVNYENLKECIKCGADAIVTTRHTVFGQPEGIEAACRKFERVTEKILQEGTHE